MAKKNYNKIGIYKIQSNTTSQIYIGGTSDIGKRWWKHINNLKNNIHPNYNLQNHVNQFGINDLQFSIIEFCFKDQLREKEQYYIDLFAPPFNIAKIVGSSLGTKRSDMVKEKMRLSHVGQIPWMKGRHHPEKVRESIRESMKNIWMLRKQGVYV